MCKTAPLLLALMTALLGACAVSPTGRQQLMLVSDADLARQGALAFEQTKRKTPVEREPGVNAYVRCVADAILAQTGTPPASWEVVVFHDDDANAFALPGRKIGVNSGLLRVARTPDQLAAVIGHEIGHVLAQHANERLSQQVAVQGGLGVAGALAGDGAALDLLGLGAQVGVLLPYSRLHESEADRIGLDLMARAGFDPRQSIELWRNMAQEGGARPPEFLSTHPAPSSRLQELEAQMGAAMAAYQSAQVRGLRPACGQGLGYPAARGPLSPGALF
ncbi:MAG TPA: M48 family metallopeptidase [Candidatus Competibacteraceae bacterium]|nr:M48 family metallopeptidase [Candidatus Competibacteraceae bacterium]